MSTAPAQAAPDREMLVELVALHAQVLLRMPFVQAVLVACMAVFMLPHVPPWLYAGWALLTLGVEVVRSLVARRLLQRVNEQAAALDPRRAHRTFVLLAAAAGGAVGLGAVTMLGDLPVIDQALFGCILFAMPAAGVAVSLSSRYIVAAYSLSMLMPAVATWVHLHPEHMVALGGMGTLYCVLIITVAADGDRLLLRSVRIRHERDRLIVDLEQRNAEVREAMQAAQESSQARARVLAAASHDLRQPLHALSVYSAVLAANPAPALLREVGGNIDQIVRSLGSLLHGLLDLSRLSAGEVVMERQPLALDPIVQTVCAEARVAAERKGLVLVTRLEPVHVLGDAVALARIVRNLLDNAVKYTAQGHIEVSTGVDTEAPTPTALLVVDDSGRGIPADDLQRIFEEFYQVGNPGRDRSLGVGLGLAIVQRLVELSGASIEVASTLGIGTRFTLRLPIKAAAEAALEDTYAAASEPTVSDADLLGRRVLLVDDETHIAQSMGQLLSLWGLDCHSAASATEAECLVEADAAPDLLIADLRLGSGDNGAVLAERLRQRFGELAVLIVTGETGTPALQQALERGFTVLHKPVSAEALREAIGRALAVPADSWTH